MMRRAVVRATFSECRQQCQHGGADIVGQFTTVLDCLANIVDRDCPDSVCPFLCHFFTNTADSDLERMQPVTSLPSPGTPESTRRNPLPEQLIASLEASAEYSCVFGNGVLRLGADFGWCNQAVSDGEGGRPPFPRIVCAGSLSSDARMSRGYSCCVWLVGKADAARHRSS